MSFKFLDRYLASDPQQITQEVPVAVLQITPCFFALIAKLYGGVHDGRSVAALEFEHCQRVAQLPDCAGNFNDCAWINFSL